MSSIVLGQTTSPQYTETSTQNTLTRFSLILNNLTKSPNLTNSTLNPTYLNVNFKNSINNQFINNSKDLTLIVNDLETFNVDNLEVLTNFNNIIDNTSLDLTFFNINSYNNNFNNTNLNFNNKKTTVKSNLVTTTTFLNSDVKLLTDMYILMLLTK